MKQLISAILFVGYFYSFSQTGITGYTRSKNGEVLPFSTVYVKGTTNGTVSNGDGKYFLRLAPGNYTIVAQYVGYSPEESTVEVKNGTLKLDFILEEQALQLKTVVVTSDEEGPAYRIVREAIKKRSYYENEIYAFKCDAYLKGLQRIDERPDKILGITVTIDTGIVYLSESVSEFAFERPDKVSERMISSKVSGDEQGFSFNQASDFNFNLYQKNFDFDGLLERELVSPISKQAFLFYDYEWLGTFIENGEIINKIKLWPKRNADPVFDGAIYIVEDTWRVHSVDLLVVKSRGLEFVDSLKINQTLAPVEDGLWMPISQRFSFNFRAFGFKGSGYFVGVYSNYEVEPNYELMRDAGTYDSLVRKNGGEKDLFRKKDFTPEVLRIEEGSNERDSTYWKKIRPIPLTAIEIEDYKVKDSVRLVKESAPYKDSIDRERNKLTLGNIFISGYTRYNSIDEHYWSIPSLAGLIQFNTVEGLALNMQATYWHQENERTNYWIRPTLRYGFSSERFYAKLEASYRLEDDKFTRFYIGGGSYISQFAESEPISPLINSLATLYGNNYMKLYEKRFGYLKAIQEVVNGLRLTGEIEYAARDTLTNNKLDYYWAATKDVNFTSNQPENLVLNDQTGFDTNQALIVKLDARIRFAQKYATRPDYKYLYASKYPELNFSYRKGLKVLGSDVNFDMVSLSITDDIQLGLIGTSSYVVRGGTFLNKKSLTFIEFNHFQGNLTSFSRVNSIEGFLLLPYYQFSTDKSYFTAHYEHHFNEFIFNKIPFVRQFNLQGVLSSNYLKSDPIGHYFELGFGIEHIFKFMRVDYWRALRNGNFFANGFTFGFGF